MPFCRSFLALCLPLCSTLAIGADGIRIEMDGKGTFAVVGLSASQLTDVAKSLNDHPDQSPLLVFVVREAGPQPTVAIAGASAVENNVLRFKPRFPLEPGLSYRAVFRAGGAGTRPLETVFSVPKKPLGAATSVAAVYPSMDVLPENQLKFYLHFSAPMSRGDAYSHVRLLDEHGKKIDHPFLEVEQELWDPGLRRFTLFIHPGRIKSGVKLREVQGPVFEAGKRYVLEIDAAWTDAQGQPLARAFRKSFQAGPAEEQPVDPANWKIRAAAADGKHAWKSDFPGRSTTPWPSA